MSYKLIKGPDDIVWVSVQPLMQDVKKMLHEFEKTDVTEFNELDKDIINFNIIGMKAIYTFLDALMTESKSHEKVN